MGCLRAARRGLAAVLAAPRKGRDRSLSRSVPVRLGHRLAALGAAARLLEAIPALGAAAVALVALVHLALGQRKAHGALQGVLRHGNKARSVLTGNLEGGKDKIRYAKARGAG